jgi:cellulose biosynthesis protein BcsS
MGRVSYPRLHSIWAIACLVIIPVAAWCGDSEATKQVEVELDANATTLRGSYVGISTTFSPNAPYYESGPKIRATASDTRYRYPADATNLIFSKGEDSELDLLFGYGWKFSGWYLFAAVGPAEVRSWQRPGDSSPSSLRTTGAVKSDLSVYAKPTQDSMLFFEGSYLSSTGSYNLQAKAGHLLFQKSIFIGPELIFGGRMPFDQSAKYDQWKLGAFVSGIPCGPISIDLSAGYVHDRTLRSGAYFGTALRSAF